MKRANVILLILYSLLCTHNAETFEFTQNNPAGANSDHICTDSSTCQFTCTGASACQSANMTCADGADCSVVCNGKLACEYANLRCQQANTCTVSCIQTHTDENSCYKANIRAKAANNLKVDATGTAVAQGANIWCPHGATCDLTFTGARSGIDSTIYCGTNGECLIHAFGDESLYGSCSTCSTQIYAENSDNIAVTAGGRKALGLQLKCPRNQGSNSEAKCVIQMISDATTDYSSGAEGNQILYWNFFTIEEASDIEFQCSGPQYDAFFSSGYNEIHSYGRGFEKCGLNFNYDSNDFYGTNSMTCSQGYVMNGQQCIPIVTSAPTQATAFPTRNPSGAPTSATLPPTQVPSQFSTHPTNVPTSTPNTLPTTSSPPTAVPSSPPTVVPTSNTMDPTMMTNTPTKTLISAHTPTVKPSAMDVTYQEGQAKESTKNTKEDDSDDLDTNDTNASNGTLAIVALCFGAIAMAIAAFIFYKWQQANRQFAEIRKQTGETAGGDFRTIGSTSVRTDGELVEEYTETDGPGGPRATRGADPEETKGNDVEFASSTPYTPGDDMKEEHEAPGSPRQAKDTPREAEWKEETPGDADDVAQWLDKMALSQYYDCFMTNGLTSLAFIRTVNDKNDLFEIGVQLKGHQMVIMAEILKLKDGDMAVAVEMVELEGGQTTANEAEAHGVRHAHSRSFVVESDEEHAEGGGGVTTGGGMTAGGYNTPRGDNEYGEEVE